MSQVFSLSLDINSKKYGKHMVYMLTCIFKGTLFRKKILPGSETGSTQNNNNVTKQQPRREC